MVTKAWDSIRLQKIKETASSYAELTVWMDEKW
jgi:hypothetical protein